MRLNPGGELAEGFAGTSPDLDPPKPGTLSFNVCFGEISKAAKEKNLEPTNCKLPRGTSGMPAGGLFVVLKQLE